MGVSIENRVVLICKDDESDWKPSGIDGKPVGSYGYKCLPNEDWRVVSEWDEQECISEFSHKENGTFIQLDSCGEGVIAIDRLALPKSTQAIVRLVSHLQGEDIHFIETVKASDIASHDWSLAGKDDKQLPFAPPPPDNWKGDSDEWWDSEVLRLYQLNFDENLENAFNTLVLDTLTACKAGIDISSVPQGKDVFVLDDEPATHTQAQINEYKKELVAYYEANNSWYRVLGSCYVAFAFQGHLTEDLQIELREMSDDFDNDDEGISFSDTSEARSKAFHTAIKQLADELTPEKLWELQEHFELFTSAELVPMVQKKPEYQPYFYKWLVRYPDELDELLMSDASVYAMFRKELVVGREAIMGYFGEDGVIVVDSRDKELCSLLKEDGWSIDVSDRFEKAERQRAQWAKENEERAVIAKQEQAEESRKYDEEQASRTDHDIFMDALNDSFLDDIFLEAERFKAEIHSNIQDIAELYCEDNEVCLTGKEPAWLIELFDKYSVYYIKS